MNKMFKRVESLLRAQGKTKVWLAEVLGESTQNINNWKKRGVPAAKVKRVAEALSVSREYLEGNQRSPIHQVATTVADYKSSDTAEIRINYVVFVDIKDDKVAQLLDRHLQATGELSFVYCVGWRSADPFVEVDIWQGEGQSPVRVFLRTDCVIGIKDYSAD